jgi:hypothetical protein
MHMVSEDSASEEVSKFRMNLKEIFEVDGITGHQMTTMALNILPREAMYTSFQDSNRENTAKTDDLEFKLD